MILYRGTNKTVSKPKVNFRSSILDFGSGFYLEHDKERAKADAQEMTARMGCGVPTVNEYEFLPEDAARLQILSFNNISKKWTDFILANHNLKYSGPEYDIVYGLAPGFRFHTGFMILEERPNDTYLPFDFYDNYQGREEKYSFHIVFKTEKSLSLLKFIHATEFKPRKITLDKQHRDLDVGNHISAIIEYAFAKTGLPHTELMEKLYHSILYEKLTDARLKTWHFSHTALGEMFLEEMKTGIFHYPDED